MKEEIGLIYSSETEGFLKRIGYLQKLLSGELRCHFCNSIIKLETFRGVFREKGELFFICRNEQCLQYPDDSTCKIIKNSSDGR